MLQRGDRVRAAKRQPCARQQILQKGDYEIESKCSGRGRDLDARANAAKRREGARARMLQRGDRVRERANASERETSPPPLLSSPIRFGRFTLLPLLQRPVPEPLFFAQHSPNINFRGINEHQRDCADSAASHDYTKLGLDSRLSHYWACRVSGG